MDQAQIAIFKLDLWRALMSTSGGGDPMRCADTAEKIYEQFYLGKSHKTFSGSTKPKKPAAKKRRTRA